MYGANNPMIIKHMSYRVEFQGRGAAHIHGVLWLNIKEMENTEIFKEKGLSNGNLSGAFKNAAKRSRQHAGICFGGVTQAWACYFFMYLILLHYFS